MEHTRGVKRKAETDPDDLMEDQFLASLLQLLQAHLQHQPKISSFLLRNQPNIAENHMELSLINEHQNTQNNSESESEC